MRIAAIILTIPCSKTWTATSLRLLSSLARCTAYIGSTPASLSCCWWCCCCCGRFWLPQSSSRCCFCAATKEICREVEKKRKKRRRETLKIARRVLPLANKWWNQQESVWLFPSFLFSRSSFSSSDPRR